jgi:hypothetical protein
MRTIKCQNKVVRADDYTCTKRGPVLDGEIITDYGIFVYDKDRYIKRIDKE